MSRKRYAYDSADLLAELQTALRKRGKAERAAGAWRVLQRSLGREDAYVIRDYALEHGAIVELEAGPRRGDQGRVLNETWHNPCDGSEMIWIPPGPVLPGRPPRGRQKPVLVEVPGFSLARHPVTNAQFARFLEETDYHWPAWHPRGDLFLAHWNGGRLPPEEIADHPVTFVSYIDALHYCQWAGLVLPTEWLWEKAARGPESRAFPWGPTLPVDLAGQLVNVASEGTVAVGSYPRTRTAYGCEDMIGNVSEWCRMTTGDKVDEVLLEPERMPPKAPTGIEQAAVRGACYLRQDVSRMVAWRRRRLSTTRRNAWVGFRPACLLSYRPVVPA